MRVKAAQNGRLVEFNEMNIFFCRLIAQIRETHYFFFAKNNLISPFSRERNIHYIEKSEVFFLEDACF